MINQDNTPRTVPVMLDNATELALQALTEHFQKRHPTTYLTEADIISSAIIGMSQIAQNPSKRKPRRVN